MGFKKNIPNAITCGNLLCGCLAIVTAMQGNMVYAAYLVGLAAIFDFFDGFAARMLRVTSPIGKDLDSLADMVTFGVVPGILMYLLIKSSLFSFVSHHIKPGEEGIMGLVYVMDAAEKNYGAIGLIAYFAFLIPVFSAVRLAKFNNDTRQTSSFIGLPTPANAILICSFPLILRFTDSSQISQIILNPFFLVFMCIGLSILLIAEIPLFALKFRTFSWVGNRTRYIFLMLCVVLLILFGFTGIPLIILLYVLMSINSNYFAKRKERA